MLKSLDVIGFKSFADRTRFDFASGITAVVGPNGSGKSNVVDAIKWILGDQSAKSLRGKEMLDVVFNGSAARKESPFAEATLTFDNASGFLPLDQPEVQIGRRLWRSGDAEYLINQNVARLKDVRNLFLGTGAGTSAYAIIEQGRVDQILQANATNRRLVFEEAAGISRYRARKTEAERKLERVEQNLTRLSDIVEELERQLDTMRGQAQKAAKYHEVSSELKTWWIALAADECRLMVEQLSDLEREAETRRASRTEWETVRAGMQSRLAERNEMISSLEDRLYEREQQSTGNREAIAERKAALKYQASSLDVTERELEKLQEQRTGSEARRVEVLAERDRTRVVLEKHRETLTQSREQLFEHERLRDELGETMLTLSAQLTTARNEMTRQVERLAETQGEVETLTLRRRSLDDRADALDGKQQELLAEREETSVRHRETEQVLTEMQNRFAKVDAERQRCVTELDELLDRQDRERDLFANRREERSGCAAQIKVLEEFERRQHGRGPGAKEILQRSEEADYPPWNRIRGSVGGVLEVEPEYAALVEIALGPHAEDLIIQEFETLLEYLGSGAARFDSQVGFLSVTESALGLLTGRGLQAIPLDQPDRLPDLSGEEGVIARADRLVTPPSFWQQLPELLLGRTWIVDRIETAIDLGTTIGLGQRFVTLQGEAWEAGRLTAGLPRMETSQIGRGGEIKTLRRTLRDLDRQIEQDELTLGDRASEIAAKRTELQAIDERSREAGHDVTVAQQTHNEQVQALQRHQDALTQLDVERATLGTQGEELTNLIAGATDTYAKIETGRQELESGIAEYEYDLENRTTRLSEIEEALADLKLDVAKQEERASSLEQAVARLEHDSRQKHDQHSDAEDRYDAVRQRRRDLTLGWLNTSNELAEHLLEKDRHERAIQQMRSALTREKAERAELDAEESRLREAIRQDEDRLHRLEIAHRDLLTKRESLAERMDEEYHLTLDEVLATDASAFDLYAQEQNWPSEEELAALDEAERPEEPDWHAVRAEIEERVAKLRRRLKAMGSVNTDSLEHLDDLEERFTRLSAQLSDLTHAKRTLEEIVRKINHECKRLFAESFETIRENFRELFRKLFGGGEGDVILEDPEDMLDCGIEIVARPPGKELRSMSLLSGGEKTLTAVGLLLAIFKSKPSPFCILDEVDAALDDANISRFVNVLKEFVSTTQFVMITHRKPSMVVADVLYGVTMEEAGVSKKMSVRFDEVGDNGEFRPGSQAA